jgi:hypothetical protein
MSSRTYIVVRGDLPPGTQAAQAVHAAMEYTRLYHHVLDFADGSVVILACQSERALIDLMGEAGARDIEFVGFREPDLDGQWTAAAFNEEIKRLVANLPLALSAKSWIAVPATFEQKAAPSER